MEPITSPGTAPSRHGDAIVAEADFTWTRKYWYNPIGLAEYLDLIRRAVELRASLRNDVEVSHFDDDGAYIQMAVRIQCPGARTLHEAWEQAEKVSAEMSEAADRMADEVGRRVAEVAASISGWGGSTLEQLVNKVETAKGSDEKGRALEELMSRLFETIPGFTVTGRVRTQTEEIDITIMNDSDEPWL